MRFLFGDSTPFPPGHNFLATLEVFMAAATRIVQLDYETRSLERQSDEVAGGRIKGLEALDQFHTVVMRAVQEAAHKVQHPNARDYAARVGEFAAQFVEEHRVTTHAANDREAGQCRSEKEQRVAEERQHLETFLKAARLPVRSTSLAMRLVVDKDATHQMSAVFDNPDGIQTSFTLGASKVASWNAPRKVSDFAQDVYLMVGVDKSWLRGTVSPKQVHLDDWIVGQFETSDDGLELWLRRKPTEKDSLVFHLKRTETGLVAQVEHPGQPGAESLGGQLANADVAQLERLWLAMRTIPRELLEHREQLLFVTLDGQSIFENGLVLPFVQRLVTMFAPTVREMAQRSPNEFELSLKMEGDDGRREEIYLRKDQLANKLQPLPAAGRELFAPLGLDSWVPGVTQVPPAPVVRTDG